MNRITLIFTLFFYSSLLFAQQNVNQLSLNGNWEIIFDTENEGQEGQWQLDNNFHQNAKIRQIQVPSCWEEFEKNYEGVAFYRKKFNVPASWSEKIIELKFDASNYKTEVWVNDMAVGVHKGGYTPFSFRIDNLIKSDQENTITVRVVGPIILTDKVIDGIGRQEVPMWRGGIVGGIWQSVNLYATGSATIKDVFIEPKIELNTALFQLELENNEINANPVELNLKIFSANGEVLANEVKTIDLKQGKSKLQFNTQIPDTEYWSFDNPYLYKAELELKSHGVVSDQWESKFGMREFTVKNEQYHLNGKPMFLKAIFFEGLYPVKIAYPDSREMAIKEIQLAKEAGFNMIRPWRKPPPPMWLDICDSLGLLTVGSLVIECMDRPIPTPYLPDMVENELEISIMRDRNRTCVVMWELFNELSHGTIMNQMLHSMSLRARELDPTRLILDESGGYRGANMYLPYSRNPLRFNDIHHYPGSQVNEEKYNQISIIGKTKTEIKEMGFENLKAPGRNVQPTLMSFLSELGYASYPNFNQNNKDFTEKGNPIVATSVYHLRLEKELKAAFQKTGFNKAFPDFEKYCIEEQRMHGIANKRMIEATRCNPKVNGYCIHALTDGDWILGAGIVDLWRNPKTLAYDMTKEANGKQIVSIRIIPRNIYAKRGAKLKIAGVNEVEEDDVSMSVIITSKKGKKVFSKFLKTKFRNGISNLFEDQLNTASMKGSYSVEVVLNDASGKKITSNTQTFDVFTKKQLHIPKNSIALVDPLNSIAPYLKEQGIPTLEFSSSIDVSIPVVVGKLDKNDTILKKQIAEVKQFVDGGGFALFLEVAGTNLTWGKWIDGKRNPRVLEDFNVDRLPMDAILLDARGNYIPRGQIVTDGPVFKDLPTNIIMSGVYENIHPKESICRPNKGNYLAGSVAYEQNKNMDIMLRHYNGVGDVYWAADVLLIEYGKGEILYSTLQIIENLGKDPVAEKVLYNMVKYNQNNR